MGAPQYEQAGADIGGTGTTNTIPRWTGPSTLGDSGLIDDGTQIYTTTRNVGIGTASPVAGGLTVYGASNGQVFVQNSSGYTRLLQNGTDFYIDGNVSGSAGNIIFRRGSGTVESARIDSSGRLLVNTPTATAAVGARVTVANSSNAYISVNDTTANRGILLGVEGPKGIAYTATGALGSESYVISYTFSASGVQLGTTAAMVFDATGSQQGLKLPATPGNADTQTLDAYQEIGTGTPAEIALTLTCGTSGTITVNSGSSKARVTRVGNKVIGHGRIVVSSVASPVGRLSCTLTGCPQPFTNFVCETRTNDTTGLASGNMIVGTSDTAAPPTIYFDRYSPNTANLDAAANIQAGTTIVFSFSYSV